MALRAQLMRGALLSKNIPWQDHLARSILELPSADEFASKKRNAREGKRERASRLHEYKSVKSVDHLLIPCRFYFTSN